MAPTDPLICAVGAGMGMPIFTLDVKFIPARSVLGVAEGLQDQTRGVSERRQITVTVRERRRGP